MRKKGSPDPADYSAEAIERQKYAWEWAKANIVASQLQQKKYYDAKATANCLAAGDLVTIDNRYCPRGKSSKLVPKRKGLYRIIQVDFPNAVIKRLGTRKLDTVHLNRLRISRQTGLCDYPSENDDADGDHYFCPDCQTPFDAEVPNQVWTECETCGGWFCPNCTGFSDRIALPEVWNCNHCQEAYGDLIFSVTDY